VDNSPDEKITPGRRYGKRDFPGTTDNRAGRTGLSSSRPTGSMSSAS
jgi:hypothetical protein